MKYKQILQLSISEAESMSEKYKTTVYISDSIHDIVGGYYKVHGKFYYDEQDEEKYDYYWIKAYTRKQARKFYNKILNNIISKEFDEKCKEITTK